MGVEGALLAVKICRFHPFIPFDCLASPVYWPSDLCRSHVPDSSLGKQLINRLIGLYPDSITPHAHPLPPGEECACACSSVCSSRGRVGLHIQVCAWKARFEGFLAELCMCVYVHVSVSASSSLSPQGLEVTAVRKQIDFSPPTHKQLTTQRSIRHMLQKSSDKPLPWPGICFLQTNL